MQRATWRVAGVSAVVGMAALSALIGAPAAGASGPPAIDPGQLPAAAAPAPPFPVEPANACINTFTVPSPAHPPAQAFLDVEAAWRWSRGAGQTVAVIDTGVARHPRLPQLVGGGDYVATSDGTEDCDSHGTVVAGLIGAQPSSADGFAGMAPDARIISIRQSSEIYRPKGTQPNPNDPKNGGGVGTTTTLAQAVRTAADSGATVINISEVACGPGGTVADLALGAAVQYAVQVKDVVIVAAAGNNDNPACKAGNADIDPLHPAADPWDGLRTAVTPAWYDSYVLAVGATDLNGQPSKFTVPGPWVGVAAPGEEIVSLDPHSAGLINATQPPNGQRNALAGTSFAAPYVAGLAALVRSRYPQLSATEVIKRIEATAHRPPEGWNEWVGFGSIDPMAALTHEVPPDLALEKKPTALAPAARALPVPQSAPEPDHTSRNVALIGSGIVGVLLVLGVLASFPLRHALRRDDE
ncbi:type VII secretion-associated serine protease mycosin [Nocardia veterana]|uniref:Type VII secretion-associated serine protease mycosin n=3 Tax=Nocardia TaxID=1817 RepID=A0A7X6M251_9NOCA|nr:type VII secretion-associated serine protease mycosin [Nocardia veterana]